jgi:hypothetical protein
MRTNPGWPKEPIKGARVFRLQRNRLHDSGAAERAGTTNIRAPVLEMRGQGKDCGRVGCYSVRLVCSASIIRSRLVRTLFLPNQKHADHIVM